MVDELRRVRGHPEKKSLTRYDHLRQIGALRLEVVYYKSCLEGAQTLCQNLSSVVTQLWIGDYLHGSSGDLFKELAMEVESVVEEYHTAVESAEHEWEKFWCDANFI